MSDDLSPDARRLVDLARKARTPGEEDKLRIAERLAVPLAAGAAIGTAVGTAKAGASSSIFASLGAKVAAVVGVSAVTAAVVLGQVGTRPGPSAVPPPSTLATPAPPVVPKAEAVVPQTPPEDAPVTPESLAPSKPTPPGSHSVKPADELAQEAALLHEAQAAWRAGQSAQALELANQHAQRFPRSQLANERDVLRVLSLCKLGQTQAAKQVGARLLRKAKGSPWYQSVAQSCAAD
jgi:hypothetical protein